jgi:hypothetical protein
MESELRHDEEDLMEPLTVRRGVRDRGSWKGDDEMSIEDVVLRGDGPRYFGFIDVDGCTILRNLGCRSMGIGGSIVLNEGRLKHRSSTLNALIQLFRSKKSKSSLCSYGIWPIERFIVAFRERHFLMPVHKDRKADVHAIRTSVLLCNPAARLLHAQS